jgi:zinc protease
VRAPARLTRLENGLQVVSRHIPSPVVAVYLWFEVGAADESDELSGAAHFLEHLVFKGTATRGVGESAATIEALGGDLNAWTSHDQTVLHATVQASAWADALDVLVDMAWSSTLPPVEVEREREVVLEEIRSYADDPDTVAREAGDASVFGPHPYARPVLGSPNTVSAMGRDSLVAFHHANYVPCRTVLAIAGPVDHDEAVTLASELCGERPPGAPRPPVPAPTEHGSGTLHVDDRFDSTVIDLAWPTVDATHADAAAIDVLAAAVGQGASSLLSVHLQLKGRLVGDAWCDHSPLQAAGTLHIGLQPLPGQGEAAVLATLDLIDQVVRNGLPGRQVARARNSLLADLAFAGETVDGVAQDLAWYLVSRADPDFAPRWRRAIAAVSSADVRRVAARWLRRDRLTIAAVSETLDIPAIEAARLRPPAPIQARSMTGDPVVRALPRGARLVCLPDDGPVVGLRVLASGGALEIDSRSAGIGAAWSRLLLCGAGGMDTEEFSNACDALGAVFDPGSGRGTLGIALSLPSEHLADGIDLLGKLLVEPAFDRDEWDRVHEELDEDLRTRADRPTQVASELVWRSLWPGHPWRLPAAGTPASLRRLTPSAIRAFHRRHLSTQRLIIGVAGGADPDQVAEAITPWLARLDDGSATTARPSPGAAGRGLRTAIAGREQAIVLCAARGVAVNHPGQLPLRVAAAILSSQGGRLFGELREVRGLAYHVWCSHITSSDGGVLGAGLATDPERATAAMTALRNAIRDFERTGPTAEELERAVAMMAGQAAMSLQRASARASELAATTHLGLPYGVDAFRRRLSAVSVEDVQDHFRHAALADGLRVIVRPDRS